MTCLEAQSKIIAYIDYKLEKEEKTEFLKHIKCCENCHDELNIYYTMIEGMRQLDSNLPLSKDFSEELENRMAYELKASKKKREIFQSSVFLVIAAVVGFGIFGYVNFLRILKEDEQKKLKEAQGEYYYSDTFDSILFGKDEETLGLNLDVSTEEPGLTFYEKVREYEMLN
ncbi:MAG: hypothetical protein PUC12_15485 [Clostridiales bacterium]|nr:hypothetical protein [Clostridiales bacterium]